MTRSVISLVDVILALIALKKKMNASITCHSVPSYLGTKKRIKSTQEKKEEHKGNYRRNDGEFGK